MKSIIKDKHLRATAAKSLNEDLKEIQKWASKWNVLFGAAKCKCVTIGRLKDAEGSHPELNFMDTILGILTKVDEVELLEITIYTRI